MEVRNTAIKHVKSIPTDTREPENAVKRLCGTPLSSSPWALLHLYDAFVISNIMYGFPNLNLWITQQLVQEIIHRTSIRRALSVPRQTSTTEICAESTTPPITDV